MNEILRGHKEKTDQRPVYRVNVITALNGFVRCVRQKTETLKSLRPLIISNTLIYFATVRFYTER
jgi:hypothetical protein